MSMFTEKDMEKWREVLHLLKVNQILMLEIDGINDPIECTLDSTLMPRQDRAELHQTRIIDYNIIPVWNLQKFMWNNIKIKSIKTIKVKNVKSVDCNP